MTLLATWWFRENTRSTATRYSIIPVARFVVVQVPTNEAVSEALDKALADAVGTLSPTTCKEPFLYSVAVVRA